MRNGVKDYFSQSRMFFTLIAILVIILWGFILYNMLTIQDLKLSFYINYDNIFEGINIEQQSVIAELTKLQIPQINYDGSKCSNIFVNSRAMVIGDSTAEGLVAYGIIPESNVVYTRGRTIQYMEADLDRVLNYNPDILFLAYGANDLLSWNGNVDGYIQTYSNVLDNIQSLLPNTKLCVNSILPVSDTALEKNYAFSYQQQFNERLEQMCTSKGIIFVENGALLNKNDGGRKYESDGIHPKPFYYRLWGNNMIEVANLEKK